MDVVEKVNVLSLLLIGMFDPLCSRDLCCSEFFLLYIVTVLFCFVLLYTPPPFQNIKE